MLIDVVYCRQFHNNSAYVIASSSAPIIEYAFIRCLVFVSLFKYKILFKFFSDSFPIYYQIPSFMYAAASIQMLFHKMDFKGLKRNMVTRKRLLLFVVHMSFGISFITFGLNIFCCPIWRWWKSCELIKGNLPKWTDLVFAFSFYVVRVCVGCVSTFYWKQHEI